MTSMGHKRLPQGSYSVFVLHCVLLLLLFSSTSQAANHNSENVKFLVNKIAAAYGGKETIETVRSVVARGKIEALSSMTMVLMSVTSNKEES